MCFQCSDAVTTIRFDYLKEKLKNSCESKKRLHFTFRSGEFCMQKNNGIAVFCYIC